VLACGCAAVASFLADFSPVAYRTVISSKNIQLGSSADSSESDISSLFQSTLPASESAGFSFSPI
jgi:hypothetical protein